MLTPYNSILSFLLAIAGLLLTAAPKACAQLDYYWRPASGSGLWFSNDWRFSNGAPGIVPTAIDNAFIESGYTVAVTVPGAAANIMSVDGSVFVVGGGSLSTNNGLIGLGGNGNVSVGLGNPGTSSWTNSSDIHIYSSGSLTISARGMVITRSLGGSGRVTLDGGTLRITESDTATNAMSLEAAGGTIDIPYENFNSDHVFSLSGLISGAGGLTKTGQGTLLLTGANTYAGGTTLTGGILSVSSMSALGGSLISIGGGQLRINTAGTASTAVTALAAGAAIEVPNADDTVTMTGNISGPGALTKFGAGILNLTGTNTYAGATNVFNGTLSLGSANAIPSTGPIVFGSGVLQYSSANTTDYSARFTTHRRYTIDTNGQTVTFASALNTGFSLTKTGGGLLTLTANSSIAEVAVTAGTLAFNGNLVNSTSGTIGPNPSLVRVNGGWWNLAGELHVGSNGTGTLNIAEGGSVTSGSSFIGSGDGSPGAGTGTANVAGVWTTNSDLTVGLKRNGVMNITGYGSVNSPNGYVANGTVNIGGGVGTSHWTIGGNLDLGYMNNLTSTLMITGGGSVSCVSSRLSEASANVAVNVSVGGGTGTSSWTISNTLQVGRYGTATLTITGGGHVMVGRDAVLGRYTDSFSVGAGTITVGGGTGTATLTVTDSLWVGGYYDGNGKGTLNINTGGLVITGFLSGGNSYSKVSIDGGTLRVNNGQVAGNIIQLLAGGGTIEVPTATNTLTLFRTISGTGGLTKTGAGTLVLGEANTFGGGTIIASGRLLVSNSTGSAISGGPVTVATGATLSGGNATATLGFIVPGNGLAVIVHGTLAPGNGVANIGVLTLGTPANSIAVDLRGTYAFDIATSLAGSLTPHYDGSSSATRTATTGNNLLAVMGTNTSSINLNGATIQLNATSSDLGGTWDNTKNFSWLLATLPEGVTPTMGATTFNTTGFAPALNGGSFSLSFEDATNSVYVNFTPVPEPAIVPFTCLIAACGWPVRRRMLHQRG